MFAGAACCGKRKKKLHAFKPVLSAQVIETFNQSLNLKMMHMKKGTFFGKGAIALLLTGTLFFTACKKELSGKLDELNAVETTVNDIETDAVYEDVNDITMGISTDGGEELGFTPGSGVFENSGGSPAARMSEGRCFTLTVVPQERGVFPKTVTIDFGSGCLGRDGKTRTGKIITVFTGPMRQPGNKATTTFDGYKVDSIAVTGTHEVINNSIAETKILTKRVLDGKLTWNSGRWVKWNATRTFTFLAGADTPEPMDNVIQIIGAGRGENSKGKSWSHEVIEPLIKKFTCRWITKGVVKFRHNEVVGLLNFGNGDCDNKATILINSVLREISLR